MARARHVVPKWGHCRLLESCGRGRLFVRKQSDLGTSIIRTTSVFSLCVYVSSEVMFENCMFFICLNAMMLTLGFLGHSNTNKEPRILNRGMRKEH